MWPERDKEERAKFWFVLTYRPREDGGRRFKESVSTYPCYPERLERDKRREI